MTIHKFHYNAQDRMLDIETYKKLIYNDYLRFGFNIPSAIILSLMKRGIWEDIAEFYKIGVDKNDKKRTYREIR